MSENRYPSEFAAYAAMRDQPEQGHPRTREDERAALVGEIGDCCNGADPLCAGGCLVAEAATKRRGGDQYVAYAVALFMEGRRQGKSCMANYVEELREARTALRRLVDAAEATAFTSPDSAAYQIVGNEYGEAVAEARKILEQE